MTHFSDAELIDAAERTLPAPRLAHLDSCERCRAAASRVASVLDDVSAVSVPEPSPLFWDHFSARVHEAVVAEPAASPWASTSLRTPWIQLATFCALVIAVASAAWFVRPSGERAPVRIVASTTPDQTAPAVTGPSQELAEIDDPAWAVLSAAAADLSDQDDMPASTLTVRPAAVDSAVQQLTPQERQELRRLLQSEMKRSSD